MANGNSAQLHGINSRGEAIDDYGNVMSWVDPNDVMGLLAKAIMYGDNYYGTASDIRAYFNNQGMSDDEINSRLSPEVKQQLGSQLSFKQSQSNAYNPNSVNNGVSFLQEQGISNQEINNDVSQIAQSYQDANANVRAIQQAGEDQSGRELKYTLAAGALAGGAAGLGLLGEAPIASELGALGADATIQAGLGETVTGAGTGALTDYGAQTAAQTGLDNLVAQQSALYPTVGDNIVGLPQAGNAALTGVEKGVLTNVATNALTGRDITPQGVAISALTGGVGGGAGNLAGQLGADTIGSGIAGGIAGGATGAGLSGGNIEQAALKGALTGGLSGATSDLYKDVDPTLTAAGKTVQSGLTNAALTGNTTNLAQNLLTSGLASAGLSSAYNALPSMSDIKTSQSSEPPINNPFVAEATPVEEPKYNPFVNEEQFEEPVVNTPFDITKGWSDETGFTIKQPEEYQTLLNDQNIDTNVSEFDALQANKDILNPFVMPDYTNDVPYATPTVDTEPVTEDNTLIPPDTQIGPNMDDYDFTAPENLFYSPGEDPFQLDPDLLNSDEYQALLDDQNIDTNSSEFEALQANKDILDEIGSNDSTGIGSLFKKYLGSNSALGKILASKAIGNTSTGGLLAALGGAAGLTALINKDNERFKTLSNTELQDSLNRMGGAGIGPTFNQGAFQANQPNYNIYQADYSKYANANPQFQQPSGIASLMNRAPQPQQPFQFVSPFAQPQQQLQPQQTQQQPVQAMAEGGTIEQRFNNNSVGNNQMYPQSNLNPLTNKNSYQNPTNMPVSTNMLEPTDAVTDASGQMRMAQGGIAGYAKGGNLGSYSDGGRMLKGPGDGMSDSIPAQIGKHQPARLAEGEFVIPADVVSHLGNGSTDAGAKQLYSMMDKIRQARTGRKAQGKQINPKKYLPK